MRYTGKPLATSGNTRARKIDARKLLERQNLAAVDDAEEERRPGGDEDVVATNVVAFDLERDGSVIVSDGDGIERIAEGARKTRLSRAPRVTAIAVA